MLRRQRQLILGVQKYLQQSSETDRKLEKERERERRQVKMKRAAAGLRTKLCPY